MSEFYLKVAGVTFEGRQRVIAGLKEGQALEFVPDPSNPYDSAAVKIVTVDGTEVGFVSRDRNSQIFDNLMNQRGEYQVSVSSITGGGFGSNYGCNIKVVYTEKVHAHAGQDYAELEEKRNSIEQELSTLGVFGFMRRKELKQKLEQIEQEQESLQKSRPAEPKSLQIQKLLEKVGGKQREVYFSGEYWTCFTYEEILVSVRREEYFPLCPPVLIMTDETEVYAAVILPTGYEEIASNEALLYGHGIPVLLSVGRPCAMIKLVLNETFSEDDFYREIVKAKYVVAKLFKRPIDPTMIYTVW